MFQSVTSGWDKVGDGFRRPKIDIRFGLLEFLRTNELLLVKRDQPLQLALRLLQPRLPGFCGIACEFSPAQFDLELCPLEFLLTDEVLFVEFAHSLQLALSLL